MKKLAILGTILLMVNSSVVWADDKQKIDKTIDVPAKAEIYIENQNGFVSIKAWNKAKMKVLGELDEQATGYEFTSNKDRTIFEVNMPRHSGKRSWWSGNNKEDGSNLEIYVPESSQVWFEGVNADVEVSGIEGGSNIQTVNGSVTASDLQGRIRLNTVNGDVNSKNLDGKIRLETVNGDVTDNGSKGREVEYTTVNGDLSVETSAPEIKIENVNGDIDLNLAKVEELSIETVNGDIDAVFDLTEKGEIEISTVSGDADLVFTGKISADFDIESHAGGKIKNKLSKDKVHEAKYGPSKSLEMRIGKGEARVEIDTVSGDITLMKN